jgi:hypothetical protein
VKKSPMNSATPNSVKWSAYLCLAQAALMVFGLCVISWYLRSFADGEVVGPRLRGGTGMMIILTTLFIYCVTPVIALVFGTLGAGLLLRWRWTRMAAITVSVINSVLTFPVGALFGIAVIVLLNREDARAAFSRSPAPPAVPTVS